MEEVGEVFVYAVVIMRNVLVEIVKTGLEFDGKVCPVRCDVAKRVWE